MKKQYYGSRFGRLTAIEPCGKDKHRNVIWRCVCDCGEEVFITATALRKTKSCGCLTKDTTRERNTTHGMANTRLYKVWASIKQRCTNPHNKRFADYGGRGICIAPEWTDFEPFMVWAVAHGYEAGRQIDRIDNNGDYAPDNCRFVSPKANQRNKRDNHFLDFADRHITISEWGELIGLSPKTIWERLARGWDTPAALFLPNGSKRRTLTPAELAGLVDRWKGDNGNKI